MSYALTGSLAGCDPNGSHGLGSFPACWRWIKLRRVSFLRRIWTFVFVGALVVGGLLPHAVSAQTEPGSFWHYTYPPNRCGGSDPVDPINIVFVGAPTWETVDEHWAHHLLWGSTDSGSAQSAYKHSGACGGVVRQRATADSDADDRLHARMFEFGYADEPDGVGSGDHIHVGAHHDARGYDPDECHYVPPGGFNSTRNDVVGSFTGMLGGGVFDEAHELIKWSYWNNSEPMAQECGGGSSMSDGWVAYIGAEHVRGMGGTDH